MAKELPYFRFTAQEWQNGDISLESYETKGLFIDICAYYWLKDCSLTLAMLQKKFSNDKEHVNSLIDLFIIDWNEQTDYIQINFLNEQYDMLSIKRKKRQNAGRTGGLKKSSNARILLKQKSSYKDKDKEKDNNKDIEERKADFSKSLTPHLELYGKDLLNEFYLYWTEHGEKDRKMKFEKQKSFGISQRLRTWNKNNFGNEKNRTNNKCFESDTTRAAIEQVQNGFK